jgi:lactate permease
MPWIQVYDPLGNPWLSTLAAAFPIVLLLVTLGLLEWRAHIAAFTGLAAALAVSVFVYGMPMGAAGATAVYGAAYGLLPIGWIVVNAVFLYNMTVATGQFDIVKASVARLSPDRRIQALLIAFSFGAFIEGACGFGTPVAICSALLMGLGFTPLYAAVLSLIANTAPVAFGAIGTPILTLAAVTGLPVMELSQMAGRQLPFVSVLIPAWLVATMSGRRGLIGVWPAVLVSGGIFGVVQFAWSNYIGPELVDIVGGIASLVGLTLFCRVWKPREIFEFSTGNSIGQDVPGATHATLAGGRTRGGTVGVGVATHLDRATLTRAWMPWAILSVVVIIWGLAPTKALLNGGPAGLAAYQAQKPVPLSMTLAPTWDVPLLHRLVFREFPVEPVPVDRERINDPQYRNTRAEAGRFTVNYASATGSGILVAAILTALYLRIPFGEVLAIAAATLKRMRVPLITIAVMMSLGFVTRYGGTDATLGLAFTKTGWLYPFFATYLGWLGVALTGSDTSSNVLFGSLQKITAQQLGLSAVLVAAANSTGGVMGKMIDAQSIVVATASTGQQGQEGRILRFVFWHSVALAAIMGVIVMLQAYVFTWMIPGHN